MITLKFLLNTFVLGILVTMGLEDRILFFFSAIGAFNGLFLSSYFAFFVKNGNRASYFLSALLFVVSIRVTKSVLLTFYDGISNSFIQIGLSACLLIGPFLYLYVTEALNERKPHRSTWLWHVLPVIFGMVVIGYYFPYKEHRYLWQRSTDGYLCWILFGQWLVYIVISLIVVKQPIRKLFSKGTKLNDKEIWLISIVVSILLIWIAYFTATYTSYIVGALSFSFVLYLSLLLWGLKRRKSYLFFETPKKYGNRAIHDSEAKAVLDRLGEVMANKALFKNYDIKLKDLAMELGISAHYLSQLLNDNLGKSFARYLNELRTEEAKRLIQINDHFTLEAIGQEAGFSSRSTFYAVFKKITGMTPAQFKKSLSGPNSNPEL